MQRVIQAGKLDMEIIEIPMVSFTNSTDALPKVFSKEIEMKKNLGRLWLAYTEV